VNPIEKLIEKHCPNGVEYKKLGDCCNILDSQRVPIKKSLRVQGKYPYYGANGIQDWVNGFLFDGLFLLIGEDGSVINKDNSPIVTWAEGKIWVNNHAHVLSEKPEVVRLRFVYFYLQTADVSDLVRGVPPKLNQENLRNIKIPIPPLPVQRKIAETLDLFASLEAELETKLEAELECRRKQYDYYRHKLLSFNALGGGGGARNHIREIHSTFVPRWCRV
jgi:type I restriction enzyme S subunit